MQPSRVFAIARRLISQIRRDHRSVGLIIVVPMFVMGLLGYILRLENQGLAVGIAAEDQGILLPTGVRISTADRLVELLGERDELAVEAVTREEGEQLLRDGSLDAVVILAKGFTQALAQGGEPRLELVLEGSNPGQRQAVMFALTAALAQGLAANSTVAE
ncbi:MAG TPA: ABC transporter permease, partial [Anaerolineales bacterium]|nr:ABC transporter permease [Anaerolineales bacterium]